MRRRNHTALKNEKDIFQCYKKLDGELSISDKELEELYEKELIDLLKREEFNSNSLSEFINVIENTNPFENGYIPRNSFEEQIKDRISLKIQDKVKNSFSCIIEGKKENSLETMIQRNIMLSNNYNDILGKPVFYEFPCNVDDGSHGKVPIDLVSYDEKENIIYLIELKKCKASRSCKFGNLNESKELFLRALLEVTTYYSFFTHLIKIYKEEVENALNKVGNVNIDLDKVEIKKIILGPKRLFDDVHTDELKKEMSNIECFTIDIIPNDISDILVNTQEKIFEIKRYE